MCTNLFCTTQFIKGLALMQLQEFQERQKKIAEMEAKLQSQDEELATQQDRIKTLHVRNAPLTVSRAYPLA